LRPAGKARGINCRGIYKPMKIYDKIFYQDTLHPLIEFSMAITLRSLKNSLEIITPLIYKTVYTVGFFSDYPSLQKNSGDRPGI